MKTLRQVLREEIDKRRNELETLKNREWFLSQVCPQIMDAELPEILIYGPGTYIDFEDKEYHNKQIGATLLKASLSTGARLHTKPVLMSRNGYFSFWIGEGKLKTRIDLVRKGKRNCKKAIVTETREIQVCGRLDESKYDKVVWVD